MIYVLDTSAWLDPDRGSAASQTWPGGYSGLPVIVAEFESFDFSRMNMDAVLLMGVLVHLPHDRFTQVFSQSLKALKPEVLTLIIMNQGQGRQELEDGRVPYV